ncbi:MAG: PAS domain S-box protein [Bacteroidota bacterium]
MDLLPEIILILEKDGRILDWNKKAGENFGLRRGDGATVTVEGLVAPSAPEEDRKLLHAPQVVPAEEVRVVRSDGTVIDLKYEIKPMHGPKGEIRVLIGRDITLDKQKDLDLLRFSNVIQHTINPIQITDASGKMVYVNPAFEKASGYTREELIGQNPRMLASGKHGRDFWSGVWRHIMSGKLWTGRVENRRKDGSPFHTELVVSPIMDAAGNVVGFLGAHRDITEQIILEQQLVRSQRMESIGTLAAGVAHEVGNPLTAISSLVQVLQRTVQDPFATEKLGLINSQISRIAKIIRDLVDFSRPSTHVSKLTDLNQILNDALNIVKYGKKVKDITIALDLDPQLPTVRIVPDQIVQVFINVLMNAVDALDGRPGTISVSSRSTDSVIDVAVSDTGKGIPQEEIEKIFEPFYTTKGVGKGTGLGLWVSYGIVKSFNGDIIVESIPGEGSLFTIRLPRTF